MIMVGNYHHKRITLLNFNYFNSLNFNSSSHKALECGCSKFEPKKDRWRVGKYSMCEPTRDLRPAGGKTFYGSRLGRTRVGEREAKEDERERESVVRAESLLPPQMNGTKYDKVMQISGEDSEEALQENSSR